jgi:hypothetical protein
MRQKAGNYGLKLLLSGSAAIALSICLFVFPAMSAPIAASKGLRAGDSQLVQIRGARGGRGGAVHRGGSVHRGGTAYRGRTAVRGGAVVRRGAVVGGGAYYGGSSCDPNYEDCGGGYSGGAAVYRGGAAVRRGAAVRGGTAVRGRGTHVAHRGGGRGRR